MHKIVELRDAVSAGRRSGPSTGSADAAAVPVPSVERITALVESLTHTLECIKTLNEAIPDGPMRDKLEIERANLANALAVARDTAARVRIGEAVAETPAQPNV